MKKSKILIHIPHSSLKMPKIMSKRILVSNEQINNENMFISDLYVDKIFENIFTNNLIFKYSRLFCDVERFKDDKLEPMAKRGMGVIYSKTSDDVQFINHNQKYKEYVIKKYYNKHHLKFEKMVDKILKRHNKCIIIDAHTYSDDLVRKILTPGENNPDICLGYDNDFKDEKLVSTINEYFKSKGFTVEENYPYAGSIVPTKHYIKKDKRITSVMIEINKRTYLDNKNKINQNKYRYLKNTISELLQLIENNQ